MHGILLTRRSGFARKLYMLRLRFDVPSVAEMARRTGESYSTLAQWERGARTPVWAYQKFILGALAEKLAKCGNPNL